MRFRAIISHAPVTQNLHFLLGNYRYTPLPSPTSIRLLQLTPSSDRRIVRCSLNTFELQHAPPFRALSYTWGNPLMRLRSTIGAETSPRSAKSGLPSRDPHSSNDERKHSIICDDMVIKVTSNLKDALRMLSKNFPPSSATPSTPAYYWIDSLCMNQENIQERNAQVAKMAEIFGKASDVIVWLGRDDVSKIPSNSYSLVPKQTSRRHCYISRADSSLERFRDSFASMLFNNCTID